MKVTTLRWKKKSEKIKIEIFARWSYIVLKKMCKKKTRKKLDKENNKVKSSIWIVFSRFKLFEKITNSVY